MRALDRYQRGRISETTRLLADTIAARDIAGANMLDIGGGIGVLQHLLLERGVTKACGVEASPGYRAAAALAAEAHGLGVRMEYIEGDFVALAPDLDAADISEHRAMKIRSGSTLPAKRPRD
jgi:magnesium-protoporphyrin O-methyltransferase